MKSNMIVKALFFSLIISVCLSQRIQLPEPDMEGGIPINEAFAKRKSERDFHESEGLTDQELSQVLWAAYGVNRPLIGFLTAPSAVAAFPFDMYAFVKKGVYKYLPLTNELELIDSNDLRYVTGSDEWIAKADLNICMMGLYEREFLAADREAAEKTMREDSGYASANLYLAAASLGLQAVTRAGFDQQTILDALGLSAEYYYIPLCFTIGR